jgi:S1-C subfamily serine protease
MLIAVVASILLTLAFGVAAGHSEAARPGIPSRHPGGIVSHSRNPITAGSEDARARLSAADVFRLYSGAIVVVEAYTVGGVRPTAVGSGLLVKQGRAVVTNAHVVAHADYLRVRLRSRSFFGAQLEIRYVDEQRDLALIWLPGDATVRVPALRLKQQLPAVGSKVFAIGNPLGLDRSLSDGIVSGLRQMDGQGVVIQHTAPISDGSSGGALFDDTGAVLGLTVASIQEGQNLNFAIPAAEVQLAIDQAADPVLVDPNTWGAFLSRARARFVGRYDAIEDVEALLLFIERYPGKADAILNASDAGDLPIPNEEFYFTRDLLAIIEAYDRERRAAPSWQTVRALTRKHLARLLLLDSQDAGPYKVPESFVAALEAIDRRLSLDLTFDPHSVHAPTSTNSLGLDQSEEEQFVDAYQEVVSKLTRHRNFSRGLFERAQRGLIEHKQALERLVR